MSGLSKRARSDMRAKAQRMSGGDPHRKVDASSWTPTEPLNTTAKTGARPVRSRIYKLGGKVQGDRGPRRSDKLPRENANAKINRNVVAANAEEFGKPHVGAFEKGGRTKRAMGGMNDPRATAQEALAAASQRSGTSPNRMDFANAKSGASRMLGLKKGGVAEKTGAYRGGTRPTGGRIPRKSGGRTKGKTNINIVIAQPHGQQGQQAPNNAPVRPPMPPIQPAPLPAGMPPGGPGGPPIPPPSMAGGPGGGMSLPMPRKSGGRTYRTPADMDAGSGGAKGRLEKLEIQRHSERKSGGRLHAGAGSGLGRLEKIDLQKSSQR